MRINKYLAHATGLSRRETDNAISAGRVTINGQKAVLGAAVSPQDQISLDNRAVTAPTSYTYLLFNKPVGCLCSRRSQGGIPTVYSLLPDKYQSLKLVGRLDKDSSGLILLTDDGDFAFQMTHPSFHKTKIYEVELDKPLQPLHQQMISDYGVSLEDGVSKFMIEKIDLRDTKLELRDTRYESRVTSHEARAEKFSDRVAGAVAEGQPNATGAKPRREYPETGLEDFEDQMSAERDKTDNQLVSSKSSENEGGETTYQVTMSEGRNRQIRRTFAALGYTVTKLHRTNFGKYSLGDIESGRYKLVTTEG